MQTIFYNPDDPIQEEGPLSILEEKHILQVMSGEDFLKIPYFEKYFSELKSFLALDEETFESFYSSLLKNFFDYCQLMPIELHGRIASLAQSSFLTAFNATKLYVNENEAIDQLWNFVIFSASLLCDIYRLVDERFFSIVDEDGEFIKIWNPLTDDRISAGSHYQIRQGAGAPSWSAKYTNTLFAKILMPENAFLEISSKQKYFGVWLALLNNDFTAVGEFGLYLERAKKLAEAELAVNFLNIETLNIKVKESQKFSLGEKFWAWLKKNVSEGKISINKSDSPIQVDKKGQVVVNANVYKEFIKRLYGFKSEFINWIVVHKQTNHLGLTKLSGYDYKFEQHFSAGVFQKKAAHIPQMTGSVLTISSSLTGKTLAPSKQAPVAVQSTNQNTIKTR